MFTLEELTSHDEFNALEPEKKQKALDKLFLEAPEPVSSDDQFIVKTAIQLKDEEANETESLAPFKRQKIDAIKSFRGDLQNPDLSRDEAIGLLVKRQKESDLGRSEFLEKQSLIDRTADGFLSTSPAEIDAARSRKGLKGSIAGVTEDVIDAGGEALTGIDSEEERDKAAQSQKELIANLIDPSLADEKLAEFEQISPSKTDQQRESRRRKVLGDLAQGIINQRLSDNETQKSSAVFKSRTGEVGVNPDELLKLNDDEINSRLDELGIAKAARDRFKKSLPNIKETAIESIKDAFRDEQDDSGIINKTLRAKVGDIDSLDEEGVRKLLIARENDPEVAKAIDSGLFKAAQSVRSMLSGAIGTVTDEEFSQELSKVGKERSANQAKLDELSEIDGATEFTSDLIGIAPDLVIGLAGAGAAGGLAKGLKIKNATRAAQAGAALTSGATGGLRTFDQALGLGLSKEEAAVAGLKSAAITSVVTAIGSGSGIEKLQTSLVTGTAREEIKKGITGFASSILSGATKEGLEEATDEIIQAIVVQSELNPNGTIDDVIDDALKAFSLGAALGGPANVAAGRVNPALDEGGAPQQQTDTTNDTDLTDTGDPQGVESPVGEGSNPAPPTEDNLNEVQQEAAVPESPEGTPSSEEGSLPDGEPIGEGERFGPGAAVASEFDLDKEERGSVAQIQRVEERGEVSPGTADLISRYTPETRQEWADEALEQIGSETVQGAYDSVLDEYQNDANDSVTEGKAAILTKLFREQEKEAIANGDEALAKELADRQARLVVTSAEVATETARTLNSRILWTLISPEGKLRAVERDVSRKTGTTRKRRKQKGVPEGVKGATEAAVADQSLEADEEIKSSDEDLKKKNDALDGFIASIDQNVRNIDGEILNSPADPARPTSDNETIQRVVKSFGRGDAITSEALFDEFIRFGATEEQATEGVARAELVRQATQNSNSAKAKKRFLEKQLKSEQEALARKERLAQREFDRANSFVEGIGEDKGDPSRPTSDNLRPQDVVARYIRGDAGTLESLEAELRLFKRSDGVSPFFDDGQLQEALVRADLAKKAEKDRRASELQARAEEQIAQRERDEVRKKIEDGLDKKFGPNRAREILADRAQAIDSILQGQRPSAALETFAESLNISFEARQKILDSLERTEGAEGVFLQRELDEIEGVLRDEIPENKFDLVFSAFQGSILSGLGTFQIAAGASTAMRLIDILGLYAGGDFTKAKISLAGSFSEGVGKRIATELQSIWREVPRKGEESRFGNSNHLRRAFKKAWEGDGTLPKLALPWLAQFVSFRVIGSIDAIVSSSVIRSEVGVQTYERALNRGASRKDAEQEALKAVQGLDNENFNKELENAKSEYLETFGEAPKTKQDNAFVQARALELLESKIDPEILEEAQGAANEAAMTGRPPGLFGEAAGLFSNLMNFDINGTRPLRVFTPFINVMFNSMRVAVETTGWGLVSSRSEKFTEVQRRNSANRGRAGIALTAGIYALVKASPEADDEESEWGITIHGSGPSDRNLRSDLMGRGWKPFSLEFKKPGSKRNVYLRYGEMPIAFGLGAFANIEDLGRYNESPDKNAMEMAAIAAGQNFALLAEQGPLDSMKNMAGLIPEQRGDNAQTGQRVLSVMKRMGSGVAVPFSSMNRTISTMIDPRVVNSRNLNSEFMNTIPFMKEVLSAGREQSFLVDQWGQVIKHDRLDRLYNRFIGIEKSPDETEDFFFRHGVALAPMNKSGTSNITFSAPNKMLKNVQKSFLMKNGNVREMTREQYENHFKSHRKQLKKFLDENLDLFEGMQGESKENQEAIADSLKQASKAFSFAEKAKMMGVSEGRAEKELNKRLSRLIKSIKEREGELN